MRSGLGCHQRRRVLVVSTETNAATLARCLSVIQAPSAQILDEQLPAGRDVTSVDGAPAPDSAAPEPLGPKVRSYLLRPQPELPPPGIPSRETAERANVTPDPEASKLPCVHSNITVVPSGAGRS